MKEIKNDIIKKYQYKDYVVYIKDVKEDAKHYEIYLQNEKYGIISLMFGVLKSDTNVTDLEKLICNNIDDYIFVYKEKYEY